MINNINLLLEFISVRDAGNIEKERILFKCKQDGFLGNTLILVGNNFGKTKIYTSNEYVYWLPDKNVKQNEYIRLYSGVGKNKTTEGTYGDTAAIFHNFYWRKKGHIWVNENNSVIILNSIEWDFYTIN
jgi:hypothetical protein